MFAPHVVNYLEREEVALREELLDALERETWLTENCTEVTMVTCQPSINN